MKKNSISLTLFSMLLIIGVSSQLKAQETFNINGMLQYSHISYFDKQEHKINGRNEGLLQIELSSKQSSNLQWKAITEVREDLSDASRNRLWIDELWARQQLGPVGFTLGKQIITWGTTDGINPVNNINPIDYSDLLDTEEEIIGIYGIRMQWFMQSTDIDLIYIPAASFGELPHTQSRWFPSASLMGIPAEMGNNVTIRMQNQMPQLKFANGEVGVRLRKRFNGFDVALSYYNGFDHLPEVTADLSNFDPSQPAINLFGNFRRQQVAGAELVVMLPWGLAFRGESAMFIPDKTNEMQHRYIITVAGIDKSIALNNSSVMVVLQYIYDYNLKGSTYEKFDLRHLFRNSPMVNIDWTFNGGLSLNALGIYNIDTNDYYISHEMSYRTQNGLLLSIQSDILGGDEGAFFGSYAVNNRLRFKMSYRF